MNVMDLGVFLRAKCRWGVFRVIADRASEPGRIVRPPEVTHVFSVHPSRPVSDRKRYNIITSAIGVALEAQPNRAEKLALETLSRAVIAQAKAKAKAQAKTKA